MKAYIEATHNLRKVRLEFQRAVAQGAKSQAQSLKGHIMEYSRRIQALEKRNQQLRNEVEELQGQLEPTEEPAAKVELCLLPNCCDPIDRDNPHRGSFCKKHQWDYDTWRGAY